MNHSLHWFDSHLSGEISSKITDLEDGVITCTTVIFRSLTMLFYISVGLFLLFNIHYIPGLVLLSFLAIYTPIMILLLKKQLSLQQQYNSARQKSVGIINDSVSNVFGIKIIGNLINEMKLKLIPSLKHWCDWDRKTRVYDAWFVDMADTIMSVIMNSVQIFVLGYLYKNGIISAGEFAFIAATTLHIHDDVDQLLENVMFSINPKIATIRASLEFINSVNNLAKKEKNIGKISGNIEYKNVKFSYNGEKNIFKNLNLKINKGEKIGIVGVSGAGKTTLIKCLLRYFDLDSGKILIDEKNMGFDSCEDNV
jgi:ATP-binding cassette subfamily B protein